VNERWRTPLGTIALLAALAVPLASCSSDSRAEEVKGKNAAAAKKGDDAKKDERVPVEVAALERGEMEAVLRYSTNLEAESAVKVYSQAARQVRELRVEEGDRVAKGQVLLRLQDGEQRTALAKVESQLAKARREYERQKRLHAQELISEQAFNDATYELEQLELALEEAQRQLSYTEVRAPIGGTVTSRQVNLGDQVTVNQYLFDIVDFNSIVARVYVPEKELRRLAVGLPARVSAPALGDDAYAGRVERLAPVVDPKSGTVKVTVALGDTGKLRPGMYVDVVLVADKVAAALRVPKRALVYDNDQIFVYRLADSERVERVLVEPVLEDRDFIQPAAGLAAGDRVVVAGQAGLKDGAQVRLLGEGT
jgi:membrane fusion protein, multidrug efflux system